MVENNYLRRRILMISLLLTLSAGAAFAQTTSFTYQGRLSDGGTTANGNYDLQFVLFDSLSGGAQVGSPQTLNTVAVSNGVFTVSLDFGVSAFPGASRFLEISARPSSGGSFTLLSPRQQINSTPYAIRSLNASTADAVIVNGVPGGSGNYIQNASTPQAGANFNISGNGTVGDTLLAGTVAALNQYELGGVAIIRTGISSNLFVGALAGAGNGTGRENSFFGTTSGTVNTTGNRNTIVGTFADVGSGNLTNATAIGSRAQVDQSNSLVLGSIAGVNFATSSVNVGIGTTTPQAKLQVQTNVSDNIQLGSPGGETGIAIIKGTPSRADVRFDGTTLKLVAGPGTGSPGNTSGLAVNTAGNVGIGTTTPQATLDVNGTALFQGGNVGIGTTTPQAKLHVQTNGSDNIQLGSPGGETGIAIIKGTTGRADMRFDTTLKLVAGPGTGAPGNTSGIAITTTGAVGIGTTSPFLNTKLDIVGGLLRLDQLAAGGDEPLCRNSAFHTIATCTGSSLRYKESVQPLRQGLHLIQRLRPVTFNWKEGGRPDLGLIAEDVAKVEPLLVTHNEKGEIEGVKYDRLNIVLINAIKQQQEQIEQQHQQIDALKKLVCRSHRRASVCR